MEMLYSYATITLKDALTIDETLLDNFQMSTEDRTTIFKNQFISRFNTKSIGAETIPLFKLWITDTFNSIVKLYEKKLDIYERELNFDDGILITHIKQEEGGTNGSNNTTYNDADGGSVITSRYDLPNGESDGYLTGKDITSPTTTKHSTNSNSYLEGYDKSENITTKGNVNVIDQREKAIKYIRNIYDEMCNEFKNCFALVYA